MAATQAEVVKNGRPEIVAVAADCLQGIAGHVQQFVDGLCRAGVKRIAQPLQLAHDLHQLLRGLVVQLTGDSQTFFLLGLRHLPGV